MVLMRLLKTEQEVWPTETPERVKAHLPVIITLPEVASRVVIGKSANLGQVKIEPEMIGHHLGKFSVTYKPMRHGLPAWGPPTSLASSPSSSLLEQEKHRLPVPTCSPPPTVTILYLFTEKRNLTKDI